MTGARMSMDDEHDIEDCDDTCCDEHWTDYAVEIQRTVTFTMRVRNDDDADSEASSLDIISVAEPYDDERVEDFSDEGDSALIETAQEARRWELEWRQRVAEFEKSTTTSEGE